MFDDLAVQALQEMARDFKDRADKIEAADPRRT
jgi:hypothetical protein